MLELLGLEITIPNAKASSDEQLAFQAQIMDAIARSTWLLTGSAKKTVEGAPRLC
jgi:hypothetical protein